MCAKCFVCGATLRLPSQCTVHCAFLVRLRMLVSLSAISGQFAFCGTLNDVLHHGMAGQSISTPQTFDSYGRGESVASERRVHKRSKH